MRKISNWQKYIVKKSCSIKEALEQMNKNGLVFLAICDDHGKCVGVLTDGDIRRSLVRDENINLNHNIMKICIKEFEVLVLGEEAEYQPKKAIKFLPIVDNVGHLRSIAANEDEIFAIGGIPVGKDQPTFVIAEIGNNHNGDFVLAQQMVREAVSAGADCVKFQMRDLNSVYDKSPNGHNAFDLGAEYTLDLLSKFQLPAEDLLRLFDYCEELSVVPLCTPWDLKSVQVLSEYGISGYKIASADLTNAPLLESVARTNKPVILSTGMSLDKEIKEASDLLDDLMCEYSMLHCNSTYPAPYSDINLSYMENLKQFGKGIVGYSGHELGYHIPIAAVALGAKIIEKHFTLNRRMEGVDHKVSLLPDEFRMMVQQIRTTEEAMGSKVVRKISQGEMINRENLSKSLLYNRDLYKGDILKKTDFIAKSPGSGIQPSYIGQAIGKKLLRDVRSGDQLQWQHINETPELKTKFSFDSKWGFPVRYHDIRNLLKVSNPKILEIHLSYSDLGKAIPSIDYELEEVIVHAPELFEGDHILDLSLEDGDYLKTSKKNLERTIAEARQIAKVLQNGRKIKVVFNAGGASDTEFINEEEREQKYANLEENLHDYRSLSDVELLPQSMPPYPWHFGGRRFHNLFVDPDEIIKFHENTGMRFCLDLSHTQLACKHLGIDFVAAVKRLLSVTSHLHIADAADDGGEGLQICDGEIVWQDLAKLFKNLGSNITWIPEIWQGHTNNNQGAFSALQKLD